MFSEGKVLKLGIMQPYFVPYMGYWQLMNAVDKYVIYDDVNYIKRGWINRNRILMDGNPIYFNIPILAASQNKLIKEIEIVTDETLINKNLKRIEGAYKKAPYYYDVIPYLEKILCFEEKNLVRYLINSFEVICGYLDITTELICSSSLDKDNSLKGKDKILSICSLLEATEYYNVIAGKELYSFDEFRSQGIELKFLKTNDICYKQFSDKFSPNLSIIDVMMFNSKAQMKEFLHKFILIGEG